MRVAGRALVGAMRLVRSTSRIVYEPAGHERILADNSPAIIALWHGQFMLIPVVKPASFKPRIMVARHGDAELIAGALRAFDCELIRGAGAGDRKKDRGGRDALRAALKALADGHDVVLTADVPPGPARTAGEGIVTLARLSGRPIIPVAAASSRYRSLATWSRMTINLPFSRIGVVVGEPIPVPREATAEQVEALRLRVEQAMDTATARAYALAGVNADRATPPAKLAAPVAPGFRLKAYRTAMRAATPLAPLVLRHRLKRGKEDPARMGERMAKTDRARPNGALVWAHAASVGETNAILPVLHALAERRPDLRILLTTVTVTSAEIAAKRLPAGAVHQYAPLDTPAFVTRFLDHWRPDIALFTESEIWPTTILAVHARRIPMLLVNARMSERSYRRWKKNVRSAAALFGRFDAILAQTPKLRRQFMELGGRRVVSAGNLKADAPPPPVDTAMLGQLKAALDGRPVWLAASTHEGEEAIVLDAHARLAAEMPGLVTIIAPRHPVRGADVAALARALGAGVAVRSTGALPDASTSVYVADTLGELGTLYSLAPVALVGGSLVPRGGQNPIEAVACGAAVLCGPHRESFADIYDALASAGGLVTVEDAAALAAAAGRLLREPAVRSRQQAAAAGVTRNLAGALERTLAELDAYLPAPTPALVAEELARAT